jgi:hypothetical protein
VLRARLKFRRGRPIEPGEPIDRGANGAVDRPDWELDMGLDVAPIGSAGIDAATPRAQRGGGPRTTEPGTAEDAVTLSSDAIPASPPPEVLDAIDAAGRVARELHAQGRELRFVPAPDGGRVRVEVRDLDGNVLREIPPSELLDLATGTPLD